MRILSCFLLSILFFSPGLHSAVIYVDGTATGSNTGNSWANAFTDLQSAMGIAMYNDELWVASGVYLPTSSGNRDLSFVMKNGVDLYGGFAGNESSISERDILNNPTTLSGDIGQPGDNSDNSKVVVVFHNLSADMVFGGFKVVSGFDDGGSGKGAGAHFENNSGAQISIRHCTFYNNYAYHSGGGLWIDESHVTIDSCEFLFNSSFNYGGGAIYSANVSHSDIYLTDCDFIGNISRDGAVINFDGNTLQMDRCLITNNTTTSGDIITIDDGITEFTLSNSLVAGNLINDDMGSLISSYSSDPNSSNLIHNTICHNKNDASLGPYREMIHQSNSAMNILNCIIYGNTPSDDNIQIDPGNQVENSIVQNGYSGGINVMDMDPKFLNSGTLASSPFDASGMDYGLSASSPAIGTGNNAHASTFLLDYLKNDRIQQIYVDRGAIESPFSDTQAPVALCQDISVSLGADGTASIGTWVVDSGSYDNSGAILMVLSDTLFQCSDIGIQTLILSVSDASGNSSSCSSTATIIDDTPPIGIFQSLEVYLDSTGMVVIQESDIPGSISDNCGLFEVSAGQTSFDCTDEGINLVTMTLTDNSGNTSYNQVNILVIDSFPPLIEALDVSLYLNAIGEANLLPGDVENGSYDECGIALQSFSQSDFSCNDLGGNNIQYIIEDNSGNIAFSSIIATILDTIPPITIGQNVQLNLSQSNPILSTSEVNNGSIDNCSFSQSLSQTTFSDTGTFVVELTSTDLSGNTSSTLVEVEVIDEIIIGTSSQKNPSLSIFPNPFAGDISIEAGSIELANIQIFNVSGKLMDGIDLPTTQAGTYLLTLGHIPKGIYFLKVFFSDQQTTPKVYKLSKN